MTLSQSYVRAYERYMLAAAELLSNGIHEASLFSTYHSFESIGGALAASQARHYPRSHPRKMNTFMVSSKGYSFALPVAHLAIALSSLRNTSLYPADTPPHEPPDMRVTLTQARSIHAKVRGIIGAVRKII